jgi:hypothetical protein
MPAAWSDWLPPSVVPSESLLYCGADPVWTPEKEAKVHPRDPNPDQELCPVCGGRMVSPEDDPIELFETAIMVCGRCQRSTYEGRLRGRIAAPSRDAATDRDDHSDRTGAAVPGQPQKTLTRRERRARQFGHDKTATGS